MNRAEFMRELEQLLQNIPESERVEALSYYEEYFNDAGEENEQKVIAELESPQKVADNIKDGLRTNMDFGGSGAHSAYQSGSAYQNGTSYQGSTVYQGNTIYQSATSSDKDGMPAWAIVLIVIGCIICSPLILAFAGVLFGFLFSIFTAIFGLVIGFGAAGVALIFAGFALLIAGIMDVVAVPFAGLVLMGVGLLLAALGIFSLMFTIWLCGYAIPAVCRGTAWLFRKMTGKDKKEQQTVNQ